MNITLGMSEVACPKTTKTTLNYFRQNNNVSASVLITQSLIPPWQTTYQNLKIKFVVFHTVNNFTKQNTDFPKVINYTVLSANLFLFLTHNYITITYESTSFH